MRLNGLKSQVQVPPLSLSMVSTPLGPDALVDDDDGAELPELQAAASAPAAMRTPIVLRRLMISPSDECSARREPGRPGRLMRGSGRGMADGSAGMAPEMSCHDGMPVLIVS